MSRVPSAVVRAILISLAWTGALGAGAACAGTDAGSINFILGYKSLTKDWYLGPPIVTNRGELLEPGRVNQPTLGVELTWGRQGWPAKIALDLYHSYDDGIFNFPGFATFPPFDLRKRARTLEVALGVRRSWDVIGFSPYLGAGGSWIGGQFAVEYSDPYAAPFGELVFSTRGREAAFGYWAGGGIYHRIGPRFQIGLAGRYSKVTLPTTHLILDGTIPPFLVGLVPEIVPEIDAGGRNINLVVGWSFPERK
jgi:hypothetical protein